MSFRQKKVHRYLPASIASLVLAAGASRASAQSIYLVQPDPQFTLPRLEYISMDAEDERVSQVSKTGGGTTTTENIYLAPTIGIGWDSFLYHPDLLTFSLLSEPGYNWQQNSVDGASSRQTSLLLNGNLMATWLQAKPYATVMNYSRSHSDSHYDFFNSATVDTEIWGVTSGYREGPVPVNFSFQHSTTDSSGLSLNSTTETTTFSLQANSSRQNDNFTSLNYQFSQYDSSSAYSSESFLDSSTTHYLTLTDAEHFGRNTLNSSFIFSGQDEQDVPSDNLNAMLDFSMEHTVHLRSFYDYSLGYYTTEGDESINQLVRAGLQHQLYDSLSSTIDIHGVRADNTSPGASLEQQSAGTSVSEDYSKQVGEWGHLSITDDASYDLTHQSSAGSLLSINNESHTVPVNGLFFLTQPLDQAVQNVTFNNGSGTVTLVQGAAPAGDYDVITTTDPWQIQIYSTGPNHVNVSASPAVQVNYTVQPNPTGNYSVFNNQFQIRLDFWHQRAGIYARYNLNDNQSDTPGFVLENVSELQAGGDASWNGFRADANYTDRHSSLYSYQSVTLSEAYSRRTSPHTTAGIDMRQQWSFYPNTGSGPSSDTTYYSFTARGEWQPFSGLSWNSEVGYELNNGAGEDQNLIVARSYLNWFIGKLELHLGWEFQSQQYTAESLERNYVFMRMRRNF
jgi:hypothetical protein